VIRFAYYVRPGDLTSALDVIGIDYQEGRIFNPKTLAEAPVHVPNPGANYRSMSMDASSLSYHVKIIILTQQPVVTSVTSPDPDGVYTVGDIITIYIVFNIPIKIYYGENTILKIPVGNFVRTAKFTQLLPDKKTMVFRYEVQVEFENTMIRK